jgi:hypothetical protein
MFCSPIFISLLYVVVAQIGAGPWQEIIGEKEEG